MELLFPPKPSLFSPPDRGGRSAAWAPPLAAARRRPRAASGDGPLAEDGDGGGEDNASGISGIPERKSGTPTPRIRYRTLSRKQARKRQEDVGAAAAPPRPVVKSWEEMTLGEKAIELYVGEKGLLFWINKFAYASIFIVIGGWILFRFVGPSLGLYQLDGAPMSPSTMFKG